VFSAKPIPYHKMQSLIATKDDFSFSDLYDFGFPDHLVLQLGDNYVSYSLSLPGVGLSSSADNAVNETKVSADRVQGILKMPPKQVFSRDEISFTISVDAVIITPSTRIAGPADAVTRSDSPILTDSPIPFPDGANNISSEGSKFRKTYSAVVRLPLTDVESFYRKELAAGGWSAADSSSTGDVLRFKKDTADLSLSLKRDGSNTVIAAITRNMALARQEGVLPDPGKARLILANALTVGVVYTIGRTDYPLRPGQGAKDYKQALNYSLAPGAYTVIVKIPGQRPQSEQLNLAEGTTWGIIATPTGGYLPLQLY